MRLFQGGDKHDSNSTRCFITNLGGCNVIRHSDIKMERENYQWKRESKKTKNKKQKTLEDKLKTQKYVKVKI